jgi:hypothetical protein
MQSAHRCFRFAASMAQAASAAGPPAGLETVMPISAYIHVLFVIMVAVTQRPRKVNGAGRQGFLGPLQAGA